MLKAVVVRVSDQRSAVMGADNARLPQAVWFVGLGLLLPASVVADNALRHNLPAPATATVWGLTFVSIKLALVTVPPFALSGWRFFMAAVPSGLFVGRPQVLRRWLVIYALFIAVGQFARDVHCPQHGHAGGTHVAGGADPGVLYHRIGGCAVRVSNRCREPRLPVRWWLPVGPVVIGVTAKLCRAVRARRSCWFCWRRFSGAPATP